MDETTEKLQAAGALFIRLVHEIRQSVGPDTQRRELSVSEVSRALKKIRQLLGEVDINAPELEKDARLLQQHQYAALQSALQAFEEDAFDLAAENTLTIFRNHVEAVQGGPTAKAFGGTRIGKKLSTDKYYLRAAIVVLWKRYRSEKNCDGIYQLVSDARKILGGGTKQQLAKIVDNHDQAHDFDLRNSKSPLSVHIAGIQDLVDNHGYRRLKDFT